MKYVLDSNIAIKWVLNEPESPQALQLREDFRRSVHELLAPDIFPIEIGHALTRAERRQAIPLGQAEILLAQILNTRPDLHASLALLPTATALSSQSRVGVYDCLYVALAESESCELVTADQRLINSFPGVPILHISQFPL